MLQKIIICLHFSNNNSSFLRALIMTSFTMCGWQWIMWVKSFVKPRILTDLPETNRFALHMPDIIFKYTRRVSFINLATKLCVVL